MDRSLGVLLAALRRRVRSMGARFFVGAVVVALAGAIWLPSQGAGGAAVALESALVVIGVAAGLAAASSAGPLPEDRASGVHAWLAATACPKAVLRAAPAVAGVIVTVAVAIGASLLAAVTTSASGLDVATRRTTPLAILSARNVLETGAVDPPDARDRRDAFLETRIDGPTGSAGSTVPVELDVRPRFRSPESAGVGSVRLAINENPPTLLVAVERAPLVAVRGRSVVELPAGRSFTTLGSFDERVDLRVVSARRIDGPASFLANVLRAGLLLGLALASLAPIAVLLSRFLSAASAVATSLLLAGVGVLHGPLLELAADAQGVEGAALASAVLHGATWLAPDLSVVSGASEALVGHVLSPAAFTGLGSPAIHAAVAFLLLAFLPARRVDA